MDGEEQAEGSESRPSLSSRINLLLNNWTSQKSEPDTHFISEPSSSRHSVDAVRHENMRRTRTRTPSPRSSSVALSSSNRAAHNRSAISLTLNVPSESSNRSRNLSRRDGSQPTFPMLRWFSGGSKQPEVEHRQPISSRDTRSNNLMQYSDSPVGSASSSTTHVLAIADALGDDPKLLDARSPRTVDLPSRPEAARLPPSMRPWRPPSHLSDLSRSTLPTACLSPTYTTSFTHPTYTDPFDDPFTRRDHDPQLDIFFSPTPTPVPIPHSPAPAHLNRSPPNLSPSSTRSSIDTLRSIHEKGARGVHTISQQQKPSFPLFSNPFGWFSTEDETLGKENTDPLSNEGNKVRNASIQENMAQLCKST